MPLPDQASLDAHQVAAARLWAANEYPYLASALFASPVLPVPDLGRIVIDQWWRLHADPLVVAATDAAALGRELVHLTEHLLRGHAARAREVGFAEQAELHHWVEAADAEINDDGRDLPPGAVAPADLDCAPGRLAEEYYRTGTPRTAHQRDCGSGCHGQTEPWEPPPPQENGVGLDEVDQELMRQSVAEEILRANGDEVPPGLRRWAEERRRAKVDWRRALGSLLRSQVAAVSGAVDYSYARPSRRAAVAGGVIFPSLRRPSVEVAIVCDTSASVDDDLLVAALAEIDGILLVTGTRQAQVLACDDAVQATTRVHRAEDVVVFGGGGTDMGAGLAEAGRLRPSPQLVVVLTDGFTPWPEQCPTRARVVVALLDPGDVLLKRPEVPAWAQAVAVESDAVESDAPAPRGSDRAS